MPDSKTKIQFIDLPDWFTKEFKDLSKKDKDDFTNSIRVSLTELGKNHLQLNQDFLNFLIL